MNRYIKLLGGLMLAGVLAACGGGGGSAGSTGTGGTSGTGGTGGTGGTPPAGPTITLGLFNASGAAVTGNAVTGGSVFARATVRDAAGAAVANKLVTFTSGGVVAFQPASGQVLTDASGVASVQVAPATVNSAGADTLTASATVDDTSVTASIDVQTSPSNVGLSGMAAAQGTLTAFQSTAVSVNVTVNGTAATTTPVVVSFTANCGSFSPATVNSDTTGRATSTFQANGCTGGPATLTAASQGATPVQTTVTVQPPQATNLLFVSASPTTIYTAGAAFGVKQSTVKFRVVDAGGTPIGVSTQVRISLASSAIASGVTFADTGDTAAKVASTDAAGEVTVIVASGNFPTPLSLNAELVSNPAITAASAGLSVNSGRAVQDFFSPSATVFNIEGLQYDGELTTLTVRVADRLAQSVPADTPVSFIAEGGQVSPFCNVVIDGNGKSGCSVTLASQASRPTNGRVTVLAYMDGEEKFVDSNGNNRYEAGETFYELGQPFLDSDEDGIVDTGEQLVGNASAPGSGIGSSSCGAHPYLVANVANTCDGAWGATRVRAQMVIVFSGSFAQTVGVFSGTTSTGTNVFLRDVNNNPLPSGTSVVGTISGGVNCSVVETIPATVPSTVSATTHRVLVTKGADPTDTCTGAELSVKAITPKGNTTLLGSVVLP